MEYEKMKKDTKQVPGEDLLAAINSIMAGKKPAEHAQANIDVANKKIKNRDEIHKQYDISGDLDPDKDIDQPGVEYDFDADQDDLEYVKHKMGMDEPGVVHKDDTEKDVIEKDPTKKKLSFSEFMKNQVMRRSHIRRAKIKQYTKH
jgi:hypothetical protein